MTCHEFRRYYSDYRDQTDPRLVELAGAHLRDCPRCAAHDRALRTGVEVLRRSGRAAAAPALPREGSRR